MSPTSSVAILRILLEAGEARGIDRAGLLAAAKIDPAVADDPDARIARTGEHAVWRELTRRSGRAFGLELAEEQAHKGKFGLLEYVLRSSRTLAEAALRVERFLAVLFDGDPTVFEATTTEVRLGYRRGPAGPPVWGPPEECAVASFVLLARRLVGDDFTPLAVYFEHEAPSDTSLHRKIFRAPLFFSASLNGVGIAPADLEAPVKGADEQLSTLLENLAERAVRDLPKASELTDRVRRLLLADVSSEPDLARVAKQLGMSPRTLQRKLQEEGLSFREVSDAARRSLAEMHLRDKRRSISEIAYALGFADPNAFSKAFRRWAGQSPQAFRRTAKLA